MPDEGNAVNEGRWTDPHLDAADREQEVNLRPRRLDEFVGPDRWVMAFSADHGVMTAPEYVQEQGGEAWRLTSEQARMARTIAAELTAKGKRFVFTDDAVKFQIKLGKSSRAKFKLQVKGDLGGRIDPNEPLRIRFATASADGTGTVGLGGRGGPMGRGGR